MIPVKHHWVKDDTTGIYCLNCGVTFYEKTDADLCNSSNPESVPESTNRRSGEDRRETINRPSHKHEWRMSTADAALGRWRCECGAECITGSSMPPELVHADYMRKRETVNHPTHYTPGVYEVFRVLIAWGFQTDSMLWDALIYLARCKKKGHELEDLKKAQFWLSRKIEYLEGVDHTSPVEINKSLGVTEELPKLNDTEKFESALEMAVDAHQEGWTQALDDITASIDEYRKQQGLPIK